MRKSRSIVFLSILATLACLVTMLCAVTAVMAFPTDWLPPPTGVYTGTNTVSYFTPGVGTILLRNFTLSGFTGSVPPPPLDGVLTHDFGSTASMELSFDGGVTWVGASGASPGRVWTYHYTDISPTRYFQEEMLSLNISGNGPFGSSMIRESPTKQSLGHTTILTELGGTFSIDSFFDVFTELSLDGGQTWIPSQEILHIELQAPSVNKDWGDAPETGYLYPTTSIKGGANHSVPAQPTLYLGATVDTENDGQPTVNSDGDDINPLMGVDDEDGVVFNTPLCPGQPATVTVTAVVPVGAPAYLNAWIDYGRDGSWAQAGDQAFANRILANGPNVLVINLPANANPGGITYTRWRVSTQANLSYTGGAQDGEVEDHRVVIEYPKDYGDAPDPTYPTLRASGGAFHAVGAGVVGIKLGTIIDVEADGQPDPNALGDDNNPPAGPDDEDGVAFAPIIPGVNTTITVTATVPTGKNAFLDAWVDFNGDGSWATPGDQIFASTPVLNGGNVFNVGVPPTATPGIMTFARFRISSIGGLDFMGGTPDGEVEDYQVHIEQQQPIGYDFGDAPEGALAYPASGVTGQFPTCMNVGPAGSFVRHTNFGGWFGQFVDLEMEGNAGLCPAFNPNSYNADECFNDGDAGLLFPRGYTIQGPIGSEAVVPCVLSTQPLSLGNTCQMATWGTNVDILIHNWMPNHDPYVIAYVNVLMDWDQNGVWAGAAQCAMAAAPEHVLVDFPIPAKYDGPLSNLLPPGFLIGPKSGYVWTRFSITERPVGLGWDGSGYFEDGESEDYLLNVDKGIVEPDKDWGDAPEGGAIFNYPTTNANGGAFHSIVKGLCMGIAEDAEPDGQPDPNAMGDDNNPPLGVDDEDGVTWNTPLMVGAVGQVTVNCTVPVGATAFLNAWLDYGIDGGWSQLGDQFITNLVVYNGPNTFVFTVPASAGSGTTFARFRLSTQPGLGYSGGAQDGEVEDEKVTIRPAHDYGDAPDGMAAPGYPTLQINNGARHKIVPGFTLGANIDAENDGQPDPNAMGDDNNPPLGIDDEDGVAFAAIIPGVNTTITVTATIPTGNNAFLDAWVDFNGDGSWATPGDQIFASMPVLNGGNVFNVGVPPTATPGIMTFARFRISGVGGLGFTGGTSDGEVEDYQVHIQQSPQPTMDFGDAPDPLFPTLLASNGARHAMALNFRLGQFEDAEVDGQPNATATGDDINPPTGLDDEDGVSFVTPLIPGAPATVNVVVMAFAPAAFLDGWIDFTNDATWATPGDQIFASTPVVNGLNVLTFNVPATATPGSKVFARFRLSSMGGLSFTGLAPNGEVEDYEVPIGYKWIQKPDLNPTGIDVCASAPYILADDFPCTVTGPITDIHVWGSWLHDILPGDPTAPGDPNKVTFVLSIHEDIPAGPTGEFSHPGRVLWHRMFHPGQFMAHEYQGNIQEGWMDPPSEYQPDGDHVCWQYDFYIDEEPFIQRGTIEKPIVYWLDVQAMPQGQQAKFGWKTSLDHWNDDAVWGMGEEPFAGPWSPLEYPPNHEFGGRSIDLAFAITGHVADLDWGDAPDPTYPTLAASIGASHVIKQGFCLGNLIDGEADGQPNANATGDDITTSPDEDGLLLPLPLLVPGQIVTVNVALTDTIGSVAFLDAWIDFSGDGSWATPGDQIAVAQPLVVGPNPVTFVVPRTWTPRAIPTFARFRLSSKGGLPFTGPASDGEVEDYAVRIEPDCGTLTFSQFIALKNHFWWPGITDRYNEMISLKVSADAVEPVKWDSLNLTLTGGAAGDVGKVSVWQDVDANGDIDPTVDTWLGALPNPFGAVTVNLAAAPVIPAGGSIKALVAYEMSGGAPGMVYTCQATGAAGTGQVSGMPAFINGLPINSCRKILAPRPISIGAAKKLPMGQQFLLVDKIVTADLQTNMGLVYIEEPDRSAGIGIDTSLAPPGPVNIWDRASVLGTCVLLNGAELVVSPQAIMVKPGMAPPMGSPRFAVGMNNKWTGGGDFGGQPAVYDDAWTSTKSAGLSNVGMLVTTWGEVTYHQVLFPFMPMVPPMGPGDAFWINDGTNLRDGYMIPTGGRTLGIACWVPSLYPGLPSPGEYWGITGILRAIPTQFLIPGMLEPVRLLVPRIPADMIRYKP